MVDLPLPAARAVLRALADAPAPTAEGAAARAVLAELDRRALVEDLAGAEVKVRAAADTDPRIGKALRMVLDDWDRLRGITPAGEPTPSRGTSDPIGPAVPTTADPPATPAPVSLPAREASP